MSYASYSSRKLFVFHTLVKSNYRKLAIYARSIAIGTININKENTWDFHLVYSNLLFTADSTRSLADVKCHMMTLSWESLHRCVIYHEH